jgi:RNA polymerase sigma factor (sigma-70 family)
MDLTDSHKLLRDYADRGDESAFRELVNRYIDLVYSAALRRVGGNADTAEDVTQAVFTDLARKARSLRGVEMLGGWLHRHTGFVASNFVRTEQRRQIREQEAAQMNALTDSPDALWQQLSPVLDETIDSLEPADRQAILLRFFERHDFRSIGATLGISDDAAQKRVSRALDKLKDLLARRGITLTVVLLGTLMAGKVVKAAPVGLATKLAGLALAGATTSAGLAVTLAKIANSVAFKVALAAVVVVTAAKLILSSRPPSTVETARQGNAGVPPVTNQTVSTLASDAQAPEAAPAAQSTSANVSSNNLMLTIVSAESGQPIPNAQLDYWVWIHGQARHSEPLRANASGICDIPIRDGTTELILISEVDGFADTRLEWNPDHGQAIPNQYTLRVAQAVPIGGRVVDAEGNPVAGAEVGFNNQVDPAVDAHIQTDDFGWPFWITAKTDAEGHWQINRIGKAAAQSIYGSASHSDYVGSDMIWAGKDANTEKQLLASTCVFSLGRAATVRGIVLDSNGQPVQGAKVLVGHVGEGGRRSTTNQADGTFSISGCAPGKQPVTAEAEGYAPTTLEVDLADNSRPVQLVLHPGHVLKLKVVDPNGKSIHKATAWLDTFGHIDPALDSTPTVQVDFKGSTDADGHLEWDSAPDGELLFGISAGGYMRSGDVDIRADGSEHVITLQPGLTISGTVTDATTGQPVSRFRVITGWPVEDPWDKSTNAQWSTIDRFWMTFDGGKFEHTYGEPVRGGGTNFEFMFKFEAQDYAPFITRVVRASEQNVRFDVALTPASPSTITLISPDGQPAAGAQVGLVTPGAGLWLTLTGFSPDRQTGGAVVTTDEQGRFQLNPDPTIGKLIAASAQGYAESTPAELANDPTMHLQPWGRLEGSYLTNGQPAANATLVFHLGARQWNTVDCDSRVFQTKTDGAGRFVFAQVPPGNREVFLSVTGTDYAGHTFWTTQPLQAVTIQPGQTTTVTTLHHSGPTANR